MKKQLIKFSALFPVIFFLAFVFPAHSAHAACLPTSGSAIAVCVISTITSAFGYIITFVAGIAVAIISWAIGVILKISLDAVNSSAVQGGYNVTLSIANLGFVLGIIIVAIATILRNQTYGIKTFLYKVVVMAVLVNFGLILAGGMINISNSLTQYFLDAITGGSGAESVLRFSNTMTAAFQPQSLLIPFKDSNTSDPTIAKDFGAPDDFQRMLEPITGLVMILVSMVMIIITLTAFLVMLIVRYVYLIILLVLLPLAWMAWVFPYLKKHFDKWWDKFIQQILFPPVALFFLWLALTTSKVTFATAPSTNIGSLASSASMGEVIGKLATDLIIPLLNIVVLSFMMVGGLMAAQSLGGVGAAAGMEWANKSKDWALKRTGRAVKRGVSASFQREGWQKKAQDMMTTGNYFQRLIGRGVTAAARPGGANQVAEYEKQYGSLDKPQLLEELRADPFGHNKNSRAAILNLLQKQNALGDLTPSEITNYLGPKKDKKGIDQNEVVFKQIGQGKALEEMRNATGITAQENFGKIDSLNSQLASATDEKVKEDLQKQINEVALALQKSLSKMSAETIANFFKESEEEAAKNPLGMEAEDFDKFKAAMARTMVGSKGVTAGKYSSVIQKIQENGGAAEDAFKAANVPVRADEMSEGIKNWLDNNGAKNLGVSMESYYPTANKDIADKKLADELADKTKTAAEKAAAEAKTAQEEAERRAASVRVNPNESVASARQAGESARGSGLII